MSSVSLKVAISARLKMARADLAMTQIEWCKASGMKLPSLRDYELGKTIPGGEALSLYARFGINVNWLLTGDGPLRLRDLPPADDRFFVPIPRQLEQDREGYIVETPSELSNLALSRKWAEALDLKVEFLVSTRMPDNSMSTTISYADLVLVDTSIKEFKGDGIYDLFSSDGNHVIRRIQSDLKGGVWVRGDNQMCKEIYVEDAKNLLIIGLAVWSGGVLAN